MKYYQVGVVDYSPRNIPNFGYADYSDSYNVGDIIPIITYFSIESCSDYRIHKDQTHWIMNTVEGLKPGDPVIFNLLTEEIYKITADPRGVGIFET